MEERYSILKINYLTPDDAGKFLLEECGKKTPNITFIKDLILHSQVDVNIENSDGDTVLIWASTHNLQSIVRLLLGNPNIKVNLQNKKGNNALMVASGKGNIQIVRMLLERPEIDVNAKNIVGNTALIRASHYGHTLIVNMLLLNPTIDINAFDNWENTALITACHNEHPEIVRILLMSPYINKSIKSKGKTAWGWSSNSIRLQFPELQVIRKSRSPKPSTSSLKLIKQNKNLLSNLENHPKYSFITLDDLIAGKVLLEECKKDHPNMKVIENILQFSPVDVNTTDNMDNSLLHWAVVRNNTEIVKLLLEHPEINIHTVSDSYTYYFNLSFIHGNFGIVKVFLESSKIKNDDSIPIWNDALMGAVKSNNIEFLEWIINTSPIYSTTHKERIAIVFLSASTWGISDVFTWLFKKYDVDVNLQTNLGNSALILASAWGQVEIVDWLLKKPEIKVNLKDSHGMTALLWASRNNHTEVVRLLLQRSEIDVNSKNENGWTALMEASNNSNDAIVSMLLNIPNIDKTIHYKWVMTTINVNNKFPELVLSTNN